MTATAALLALLAPCARAAFQEPMVSPRAAAMGGGFSAVPDDSTAMFLHVAGMSS
ncbi:MAG: hypothetical protein HY925_06800, partial [Elusimicrobia bacterium]|nr:hypothetical protein [Elusimicrobiota bacterium]